MSQQIKHPFIEWVDEIELLYGLTDNRWSSMAGISASVLSKARQGMIPSWDACKALAEAVDRSPAVAFRKAGLLSPGPDDEIVFEDWKYLISLLDPDDSAELRQIAEMKIKRRKKEQIVPTLKPRKAG